MLPFLRQSPGASVDLGQVTGPWETTCALPDEPGSASEHL